MYVYNYMSGPQFDGLTDYDNGNPQFDGLNNLITSNVYGRETSVDQSYTSGASTGYIVFSTLSNSFGTVPISTTNNYLFTNTSSLTLAFLVTYNVTWKADIAGNGVKQSWISKNNSNVLRYGLTSIISGGSHAQGSSASAIIVLAPSEYIGIRVYQNTGSLQTINGTTEEKCKIQISQMSN